MVVPTAIRTGAGDIEKPAILVHAAEDFKVGLRVRVVAIMVVLGIVVAVVVVVVVVVSILVMVAAIVVVVTRTRRCDPVRCREQN
jgi:Flp pilus assembly protein TadB